MRSFILDPILITTPKEGSSDDEILTWIGALRAWLNEASSSPDVWRHCFECTQILDNIGRFPTRSNLGRISGSLPPGESLPLLLRDVAKYFRNSSFDFRLSTKTLCAVTKDEPEVIPNELAQRNVPEVKAEFIDCLVCLACDRLAAEEFALNVKLVTMPFPSDDQSVMVRCVIEITDPVDALPHTESQPLDERFRAIFSPDDLGMVVPPDEIWDAGPEQFLRDVLRKASVSLHSPVECTMHAEFWASLEKATINTNPTALKHLRDLCVQVLLDNVPNSAKRRPILKTSGGDKQLQRSSDGASAWRLTIMDSGIGWRLQYWHISGSGTAQTIEFANVLKKQNSVRIPE